MQAQDEQRLYKIIREEIPTSQAEIVIKALERSISDLGLNRALIMSLSSGAPFNVVKEIIETTKLD